MQFAKALPSYLIQRYHGWHATGYTKNEAWYRILASEGQHPRAMIISCCDSRVHATAIFGADQGEFFVHRNIANLVPPYKSDGDHNGTSAAIEYAVTALKVAHIIVLGHSSCGGVKGCLDMCQGNAPALEEKTSFVGRWVENLRPGYEKIKNQEGDLATALEKEAILVSLTNLMGFPFVEEAVRQGRLSLHGAWTEIGEGALEFYDPTQKKFIRA